LIRSGSAWVYRVMISSRRWWSGNVLSTSLHGGKPLEYDARREFGRTLFEELFERGLQTAGHEGDEDALLDARLVFIGLQFV
jgi:hypothetical protein